MMCRRIFLVNLSLTCPDVLTEFPILKTVPNLVIPDGLSLLPSLAVVIHAF